MIKIISRPVLLICGFLSILIGMQVAPPLSASAPDPEWAKWVLDANFQNNQINATWTIQIGHYVLGEPVILLEKPMLVACTAGSSVLLADGEAHFSGSDYITCPLPDFAREVNDIVASEFGPEHTFEISPYAWCECNTITDAWAFSTAAPNSDGANPVFFHPDFQFRLPVDAGMIGTQLAVGAASSVSPLQPYFGDHGLFRSEYICDQAAGLCEFAHLVDYRPVHNSIVAYRTRAMYTGATDVYIGFDQFTTFSGQLVDLTVDPGCRIVK